MVNNGAFVLFLLIAVIAFMLARSSNGWIPKGIFFLIALGATSIAAGSVDMDSTWVMLLYIVLLISIGVSSFRLKPTSNKVFGVILLGLGIALIFPLLNQLGNSAPESLWSGIIEALRQGGSVFNDIFQTAIGRA